MHKKQVVLTPHTKLEIIDPEKLSDSELYAKCQDYGTNAKVYLRRFAGLLVEVNRRGLHRKRGFLSIYEFGKKLAGMSEFTIDRVLNLGNRLEDKPTLKKQFFEGKQGWSKIEKVSYIATPETDKQWAEKVENMSIRTLASYIQERRAVSQTSNGAVDSETQTPISQEQQNAIQKLRYMSFQVTEDIEHRLRVYKQKLERYKKELMSWNAVFDELLKEDAPTVKVIPKPTPQKSKSRHIPAKIKQYLLQKHGTHCAYPRCNKPHEIFHHRSRFAISKTHHPDDIIPLCQLHHNFLHTGLIENEEKEPKYWKLKAKTDKTLSALIDQKILKFRGTI